MLCFKFHQNRTMNEEYDFLGVKALPEGGRGTRFQKFEEKKFSNHTKNFNILAQLESV